MSHDSHIISNWKNMEEHWLLYDNLQQYSVVMTQQALKCPQLRMRPLSRSSFSNAWLSEEPVPQKKLNLQMCH